MTGARPPESHRAGSRPGALSRALRLAFYRWLRRERLGRNARRTLIERLADPQDDMMQALLQEGNSGLAVLDHTGRVVRAYNLLALLGGGPAEGRLLADMLPPAARETICRQQEELRDCAEPRRLGVLVTPDGLDGERAADLETSAVRELDGHTSGFIVRLRDVTNLRRLEAQLAHGQKLQAVGQLAGGVAHDFNNLLTAVLGAADEVLETPGLGPTAVADLEQIRASAESGARLVRQLLAFGQKQTLRPIELSTNQEILRVASLLSRSIGAQIQLRLDLVEPSPTVRMDLAQFEQVMINLVVNARDAMSTGGTLTIRTSLRRLDRDHLPDFGASETVAGGPYVVVEIEDDGVGMAPEILGRVFDPYFTTRREQGGSGLGLSTVMGIVRQSAGFVDVRSQPGRGACFRVHLPAVDRTEPPALPAIFQASRLDKASNSSKTVLLVEDEEAVRHLAKRVLARRGWTVIAASNGDEAIGLIDKGEPLDLLVTDAVMPKMGGLELARRLRQGRTGLPVILVSGYAEEMTRDHSRSESILFLPKPYSLTALVDLMDTLMTSPDHPSDDTVLDVFGC